MMGNSYQISVTHKQNSSTVTCWDYVAVREVPGSSLISPLTHRLTSQPPKQSVPIICVPGLIFFWEWHMNAVLNKCHI